MLLLVTQLLALTREYAVNKVVRRENHHKYIDHYKIKDLLCDIDCDGNGFKWIFSMNKDFQRHLGQRAGKTFTSRHKDNTYIYIVFCTLLLMIAGTYLRIQAQSNTPVQSVQEQSRKTIELCSVVHVANGAILA